MTAPLTLNRAVWVRALADVIALDKALSGIGKLLLVN